MSFTSALNHDLVTKSLESISKGVRLLNIQEEGAGDKCQTKALVYIPNGQEKYFSKKIEEYKTELTKFGKPKNAPLVNSIEDVRIALLESLWTDNKNLIPNNTSKWCEAWLNIDINVDHDEQIEQFIAILKGINVEYKQNSIAFPERTILLINANKAQLIEIMLQSDLLAEYRAGQETAGFWMNESSIDQQKWVDDLLTRIEFDHESNIKICVLDTGVNNGHQLLQNILSDADTLSVNPNWGTNDHHRGSGHGTLMAGLAGYGNFEEILVSRNKIFLTHKLCSVKILPPPTQEGTPKELWGDITAQGIYKAEIQNPEKLVLYCMAVSSEAEVEEGRPSSWSGSIDKLTYGEGENQRLIIISAGNIEDENSWKKYPADNFDFPIENPAQSWNALTIGAYTEKVDVKDKKFNAHVPLAKKNELSPYSKTSLSWDKKWPIKPDVVFEGGNLLKAPDGSIRSHDDLNLLSTSKSFSTKPFDILNATSAATAQASWFAAKIAYSYPEIWAETIRGLIIHSASWTPEMIKQMKVDQTKKGDYRNLMQAFGYGIPDLEKALYSTESALTYITQETIQPFIFKNKDGKKTSAAETNQIHFYSLPWPKEDLLSLSNTPVKLRITLSYFIEPGAGEIGWKDKYRYQSAGLRFDINNIGETETEFKKRINKAAREEGEKINGNSGSDRWVIGSNNRSNGSIHSDFWEGTAADLATCNLIGIYPVIGWWRERKHLNKVENKLRYSFIVSLETPAETAQFYTIVKAMISIPIEIKTK